MKRSVVVSLAALVIAAAAGGGYLWAEHAGNADLQQAAQQIRAALGPNGSFTYASATVHPFQHAADLYQVALRAPSGDLYTAAHVTVVSGGTGRITALRAQDLRLVGSSAPGALTASELKATDITFPAPPPGQPMKIDPAAVTLGDLTLFGLTFTQPGTAATLTTLELRDYGAGRASTLTAAGLSVPVASVQHLDHVGLSRFVASGIDLASALNAVEHHATPPDLAVGKVRVELDGLVASDGASDILAVRKASLSGTSGAGGANTSSNLVLAGVSVTPPAGTPSSAELASAGLATLRGGLTSEATYVLAGGHVSTTSTLQVDGIGKLVFAMQMAHVDALVFASGKPDPAALLAMARDAQLVSASATFTDGGMLDRVLALGTQKTGKPASELRELAVLRISQDPSFDTWSGGQQLRAALAGFLARGGTIGVSVHPAVPISLLALSQDQDDSPAAMATLLGLSVGDGRVPGLTRTGQ